MRSLLARQLRKKVARQVGRVVVLGISACVAGIEKVPVSWGDLLALEAGKTHAGLRHTLALLANFLAFALLQLGQKIFEISKPLRGDRLRFWHGAALVVPVKLHALAWHPARSCACSLIGRIAKQHMR